MNIDSTKLEHNLVICHGWAKIYSSILDALDIKNYIINDEGEHSYVIIFVDDFVIRADGCYAIMSDITRSKEGLILEGFICNNPKEKDRFELRQSKVINTIKYNKGIKTIDILKMLKEELDNLPKDKNHLEEAIRVIKLIMNGTSASKRGFYDGTSYIDFLIDLFFSEEEKTLVAYNDSYIENLETERKIVKRQFQIETDTKKTYLTYSINENQQYTLTQTQTNEATKYKKLNFS